MIAQFSEREGKRVRIISQEGFCYQDIPYEYSAFYMSTSGNHIHANCNGVVYSLAEYTTAKKAEKAMEMLHEAYTGAPFIVNNTVVPDDFDEKLKNMRSEFITAVDHGDNVRIEPMNIVFRFPQEDEINTD